MKSKRDKFSDDSGAYKRFRPTYPAEFLLEIISLSKERNSCWDCGTGNAQVAQFMASHFNQVHATDISSEQLSRAAKAPNIIYKKVRSEKTPFPDNSFDLITVAQAFHWFDFETFFKEAKRVSKNDGVLAIWGYGLLRFNNELDAVIDQFYMEVVGPFWDPERKYVEEAYKNISFPFKEISRSKEYAIIKEFSMSELLGYLGTWSAVQNFRKARQCDPLEEVIPQLTKIWSGYPETLKARFPLFSRIGRIIK